MKLALILVASVFSVSAFATEPMMIEKTMTVANDSRETINQAQVALSEDIRRECGPVETKSVDIVDVDDNHFAKDASSTEYTYTVTVKGICR